MKIYFLFILILTQPAMASDYEKCNWRNQEASPFSNTDTFIQQLLDSLPSNATSSEINNGCFLTSAQKATSKASRKRFIHCEEKEDGTWVKTNLKVTTCIEEGNSQKCKEKYIYPRRPCLDENYITNTNRIFHEMAKCFDLPPKNLFTLFNHESGFVSNIRSYTGARCYGQMTVSGIKTVNHEIQRGNPIFRNFLKNCPHYQDNLVIRSTTTKKDIYQIDCKLTKNPFSCFFYSMFLIKWLKTDIHRILELSIKKKERYQWMESELDIQLPIKLNEVVLVFDNRSTNTKFYIFKDEEEIERNKNGKLISLYRQLKQDSKISMTKIPIFRNVENKLEWTLAYWSYNGGITIASKHFKNYMTELKSKLSLPCSVSSKFSCLMRKGLFYNFNHQLYGLHVAEFFVDDFSYYLNKNYESNRNRTEVTNFIYNLMSDMNFILQNENCNL